ncbi:MAG TPA: enolase C-terminal domain-like protein [Candidatus Dormibacteraeota bacterium]|nr:enolase C-terminal domain-like protein [Candidatus Dormibacteraeota bacterium]
MTTAARATPFALPLKRPLRVAGIAVPARFGLLIEVGEGVGEAAARPGAVAPDRPSAEALRAGLECAVLDRQARAAGTPLAALLGGTRRWAIPLNALVSATAPADAAAEAAAWVARGFRCLKLKLGPRDLAGERRRLAAVRAAVGWAVTLRADANAAWSVDEAIAALSALAEFDLEYVEQPVTDVAGLAAVRRAVPVPIAADESVTDADRVDVLAAAGAADVIVIKPAWLGLRGSIDAARRAHAAGLAVTVTSALGSSVDIAAAAHIAAAIEGPLRACGLATAELLAGDLVRVPLSIADGALMVPDGPGLGVEIDREALVRFQIGRSYWLGAAPRPTRRRSTSPAGTGPAATASIATTQIVAAAPVAAGGAEHRPEGRGVASPPECSLLAQRAETHGERLALIDGEQALNFAALQARAAAVAVRLDAAGVGRGDHVGLLLGDRLSFAVWLHGIAHLGAVAVLLGERLSGAELERQLRLCPCRALIADSSTSALAAALPDDLTGVRLAAGDLGESNGPASAPLDLAAPHSVVFTSGSSGAPKPVRLTAGNHFWSAIGSALALGVRDDDRWLACLPPHHVGGLAILMRGLVSAVPVLLQARFDPAAVNDAVDRDEVSRVSLVPTTLQRVLAARGERPFPPTLRTVLLGGAPAPRALLRDCARRGVPVVTTYGMTEAASQIAADGRPLLGVALRVMRDGVAARRGEIGTIEVAGPVVSPGQLGENGWLATRDLGYLDADGRLAVVGRADDVIISGGENVHPREVEQALESHPEVAEACVFGLPDPLWGEIVAAWVRPVPASAIDVPTLAAHARGRLAGHKVPRRLTVVADFPRSAAGKILRHAVRAAALPADGDTAVVR